MNKEQLEMMREEALQSFATMPESVREEFEGILSTLDQAQAAWPLPNVPVIVLANSKRDTTLTSAEQTLEGVRIGRRLNGYREWLKRVQKANSWSHTKAAMTSQTTIRNW